MHQLMPGPNMFQESSSEESPVAEDNRSPTLITIPWTPATAEAAKGILHSPSRRQTMDPESRDALLTAIAKARSWIRDLVQDRVASFAEIADREGKVERHVRFLAPLAFVSPRIVTAILDGSAPANLTVTELATALPHSWAEQERRTGLARA